MDNGYKLMATLPSLSDIKKAELVFQCPDIHAVRFNTGSCSPYQPGDTLDMLLGLSERYQKKLYIDIKGRQLRIKRWADPLYECIELNHKIKADPSVPLNIIFRGGGQSTVTHIQDGNRIFVSPLPREALGAGQSVNILPEAVKTERYLTQTDIEYLKECRKRKMSHVMASFAESYDDFSEILKIHPHADITAKIESLKGMQFIRSMPNMQVKLMAARDDLYVQNSQDPSTTGLLREIIKTDPGAICASRIFQSLERRETPDYADYADLELMCMLGYRKFMLCDNICNYRFGQAVEAWKKFLQER